MDNTKARAFAAFALAVVSIVIALFILSYTFGGGADTAAPAPVSENANVQ